MWCVCDNDTDVRCVFVCLYLCVYRCFLCVCELYGSACTVFIVVDCNWVIMLSVCVCDGVGVCGYVCVFMSVCVYGCVCVCRYRGALKHKLRPLVPRTETILPGPAMSLSHKTVSDMIKVCVVGLLLLLPTGQWLQRPVPNTKNHCNLQV